jgi:hypothetical protein
MGGYIFSLDSENNKTTRKAWEAFMENLSLRFPKVDGQIFRPDLPIREIVTTTTGQTRVNTYIPCGGKRVPGDPSPGLELLGKLFPDDRDRAIIESYFAFLVQQPGVKALWAPLIQGVEGNGKSTLNEWLIYMVGKEYVACPRATQIAKNFNGWMYRNLLYVVDDVYFGEKGQNIIEELKPMITQSFVEIENKNRDKIMRDVCGSFILNTNHKDAIRKTRNDRRFAPFFTPQQEAWHLSRDGLTPAYFRNLYHWMHEEEGLGILAQYFSEYKIPDEFNPGLGIRAPVTSSTEDAIQAGLGNLEQEILERVESGVRGFAGGWISSTAVDRLIDEGRFNLPRNKRREMLGTLGYAWHPALIDGRANNTINDLGTLCKPKLYIKQGHLALNLQTATEVVKAYQQAQEAGGAQDTKLSRAFHS